MATSLDLYAFFDAGAGANVTEDTWRRAMRFVIGSGPIRGEDNELLVYGDSSGQQVKVKTGKVWIRGHFGENQSEKTIALAAAHATLGRIDLIVVRADFVNNRIELDKITGTASGSPVAPAVTQSSSIWEVALATVSVPAADNSVDAGAVVDARTLITPPSAISDALTLFTPIWSQTATITKTIGYSRWSRVGRWAIWNFQLTATSAGTAGAGVILSLPVAAAVAAGVQGSFHYLDLGTTHYAGEIVTASTTGIAFQPAGAGSLLGPQGGMAVASGDILEGHCIYEPAA